MENESISGLIEALARREHHFLNSIEGEYDATLLKRARLLLAENAQLWEALRLFTGAAYPVAPEINKRGYNWSEAYLDQAAENAASITTHA